ncbi:hypothetical protein MH117_09995 [Paenibacillus sp. ACRRX]|uniref:hypothetical protein n=1 Tax=Paenibacillus sp. ACRRX TaxID=2918206 RepID=UPI001EF68FD9|nr:hypothetical protein [Paenibacillus sp. ACRRX]MCG7407755.1 hypothetical protein [Paenibacillus sp. ACRRX]
MNVTITPDYQLTSDGIQFILQHRRIVDPTKAPNWMKRAAEGADPNPREKWEDVGYYSLNERGLTSAVESVIYRTAAMSDAENLREFSATIRELGESIKAEIEALIPRRFCQGVMVSESGNQ